MSAPALRAKAEALAAPLPGLLIRAEQLAATVSPGQHGRRRAGPGDAFWQYRPAERHEARRIDWRRSARGDAHFVQEREWQSAQTAWLWADQGPAMQFGSGETRKAARAAELAMALAVLLVRGGERVGLWGQSAAAGQAALAPLAARLISAPAPLAPAAGPSGGIAIFISDFLGDLAPLEAAIKAARGRGMGGLLLQILDPQEASFPFRGRSIFEAPGGLRHETQSAAGLRDRYLARLGARQEALRDMARAAGWLWAAHHTDAPPRQPLTWAWHGIGGLR